MTGRPSPLSHQGVGPKNSYVSVNGMNPEKGIACLSGRMELCSFMELPVLPKETPFSLMSSSKGIVKE